MTIDWRRALASRADWLKPLSQDAFVDVSAHPDLVLLAGGTPPIECLPIERLAWANARVWAEVDPTILYYGEVEGYEPLRALIVERMRRRGVSTCVEDVIVTNGSQQGLDFVARAFVEPGQRVIVEEPTYFGALQVFDAYQPEYVTVAIDEHGMLPAALEAVLASEPRPRLIYSVPTFQNPTGVTLSTSRRREILALAARYNVPIVEDDPYGELWYDGGDQGPLRALDPSVIYLGSFSKTLAPALRMGWIVAPTVIRPIFRNIKEAVDIQSDRMVQRAVALAAGDGWLDEHVSQARAVYRRRRNRLLDALEREMPADVRWTEPAGGFFVWVTLPDDVDSAALLTDCVANGVAYVPGFPFYPDGRRSPAFRLGFSTLPEERTALGVRRLGQVLRARLG